jgi:hypothetical protein
MTEKTFNDMIIIPLSSLALSNCGNNEPDTSEVKPNNFLRRQIKKQFHSVKKGMHKLHFYIYQSMEVSYKNTR